VTPISRVGLLLGRALMHVTLIVVQSVVITIAALPFGLRVGPANLVLAYLMLSMMVLLSTSISYDVALLVRDPNSMGALINTAGQPISLLAGVLIPLALAPLWVRDAALWNPFAWATNGMRALFNGDLSNHVIWQGAAIITVLALVTVVWSSRLFGREVS
jgi:ABC-2 type transport system permease protein